MTDSEILEAALETLVDFELELPCDVLNDVDDACYALCAYTSPQKECWRRYLEYRVKEAKA